MAGPTAQYRPARYRLLDEIGVALAVWDTLPGAVSLRLVERALDHYDDYCKIKVR